MGGTIPTGFFTGFLPVFFKVPAPPFRGGGGAHCSEVEEAGYARKKGAPMLGPPLEPTTPCTGSLK